MEIKFRIYHKTIKEILPVYELHWRKLKVVTPKGFIKWNDNVILMQYIGEKDKNSTEIYIGDIIRRPCMESEHSEGHLEEVESIRDFYELLASLGCESKDCEVVGNIHLNGNLIK